MLEFSNFLSLEKRYSVHTVAAYMKDTEVFFRFVQQEYGVVEAAEVRHQMVRFWMVNLSNQGYSARSVRRMVSSVRAFFRFMKRQGAISVDPMNKVSVPKVGSRIPEFVEEKSMLRLIDEMDFGTSEIAIRNRLIIEVIYATGIRVAELCSLQIGDIDFVRSTIKVVGKGNKARQIPLSHDLGAELNSWCDGVYSKTPTQEINRFVFKTIKGKKIYPKLVYRIVKHYLSQVTTLNRKSPHILRHSFATHLLDNGAELAAIKELLGHTSLAATQVYTHTSIDKVLSIYKQAHPRAIKRKE